MKYVGYYEGKILIKVTHEPNERTAPFEDVKNSWENTFNKNTEALITKVLKEDLEGVADVEVVFKEDYAHMALEE